MSQQNMADDFMGNKVIDIKFRDENQTNFENEETAVDEKLEKSVEILKNEEPYFADFDGVVITVSFLDEEKLGDTATTQIESVPLEKDSENQIDASGSDEITDSQKVAGSEEVTDSDEENSQSKKEKFKLTKPKNINELSEKMCTKRGRKLIYRPEEVLYEATFKVLGTDKKNEEGLRVKDILEAEIKEGVRLGYIDKFDGLKTSEIKEEYENDTVYEYAEQEFRKMGVILDGDKAKVYVYDWDRVGMHHIGYIDGSELEGALPYFTDKEKYSFDLCGIIVGGKSKTVTKDANGKINIVKDKGEPLGVELDVTIVARKD